MIGLRQVSFMAPVSGQKQELETRIDQQQQDSNDGLDTLENLMLSEKPQDSSSPDEHLELFQKEADTQVIRIFASHRTPCRKWCPCACHATQKLQLKAPGMMESVLGKLFLGYSGFPVLNKPCDFRGCKDRQNATATMEYWFPKWFVSMNLKLFLTHVPRTGPQFQLSTTRRVPDDSQSIAFAMQGNIDGLKYLFSQGLINPRDVSDSRGFTLVRVSLVSSIGSTLNLV